MFDIERGGVQKILEEGGSGIVATIEPTERGTITTVLRGDTKAFVLTEEKSASGGKIIRATGANGYETVFYEE